MAGQVVDARPIEVGKAVVVPTDLEPVAGAEVRLAKQGLSTITDANGRFHFDNAAATEATLRVDVNVVASGFGSWKLRKVPLYLEPKTRMTAGNPVSHLFVQLTTMPQSAMYEALEDRAEVLGTTASGSTPSSPVAAAGTGAACSAAYSSNDTAPQTIRVYRRSLGAQARVETYDFRFYVQHSLPREWIPNWNMEALKAGAMAVKGYAWYWVNRGGKRCCNQAPSGECYDVDDTTTYQVFDPSYSHTRTDEAVNATWDYLYRRSDAIFQMSYRQTLTGNVNEACGEASSGEVMSQYGSHRCAVEGNAWPNILNKYYSNAVVTRKTAPAPGDRGFCLLGICLLQAPGRGMPAETTVLTGAPSL